MESKIFMIVSMIISSGVVYGLTHRNPSDAGIILFFWFIYVCYGIYCTVK